jgi:hypothetical protein
MADALVRSDQLQTTNWRRIIADRDGPVGPRLVAQIEALEPGFVCPPGWGIAELRGKLYELEHREPPRGKTDVAWQRYDRSWNALCSIWVKAKQAGIRVETDKPTWKPSGHTIADAEAMEATLAALQNDLAEAEALSGDQRRILLLERRADQAERALKVLFAKCNELVDEVNRFARPNALVDTTPRVVANGAGE